MTVTTNDQDMLEEYDLGNGIRGKYTNRYRDGTNIVVLEPELIEYFPDSASVNEALRSLAKIVKDNRNKNADKVGAADD